jgi:uncharacterized protein
MQNKNTIERSTYINQLLSFKDIKIIKIVTGIRRCGKSTIFKLYQEKLLNFDILESQIININLENPDYEDLLNWKNLYNFINKKLILDKKNYVFIDEIQNVVDFQKCVDGLFIKDNVDLYLTGSNSKMQSGEWATLLSGRYVDIKMYPLSFKEYVSGCQIKNLKNKENIPALYQQYIENSSFPQILDFIKSGLLLPAKLPATFENFVDTEKIYPYLDGIYNTIILKDIVENNQFKDIKQLEDIIKFLADNIGYTTSINNIANILKTEGKNITVPTLENYIKAFQDSYIIYSANRYDVKGKKLLKTQDKYYLVDAGLRYFLLGNKNADRGRILENVIYLELLRRKKKVYFGKVGDLEVDFVVEGKNGLEYYQVAETVLDEKTLERELKPLNIIKDHNPKYLLTKDYANLNHNGILQMNVFEWLLGE